MIGKSPKVAPSAADRAAWPTGMPYTTVATTTAMPRPTSAARCGRILVPPSSTISTRIGSAAKNAVSPSDRPTGSKSWV